MAKLYGFGILMGIYLGTIFGFSHIENNFKFLYLAFGLIATLGFLITSVMATKKEVDMLKSKEKPVVL